MATMRVRVALTVEQWLDIGRLLTKARSDMQELVDEMPDSTEAGQLRQLIASVDAFTHAAAEAMR